MPAEASVCPSGEKARARTSSSSALMTFRGMRVSGSQSVMKPLSSAEARVMPSGENATDPTL